MNLIFSAAPVEVMNSDKPSHLLSIITWWQFWRDSKKDILKMILLNKISLKFWYGINVFVLKKLRAKFHYCRWGQCFTFWDFQRWQLHAYCLRTREHSSHFTAPWLLYLAPDLKTMALCWQLTDTLLVINYDSLLTVDRQFACLKPWASNDNWMVNLLVWNHGFLMTVENQLAG